MWDNILDLFDVNRVNFYYAEVVFDWQDQFLEPKERVVKTVKYVAKCEW